jgi:hypothetical protein
MNKISLLGLLLIILMSCTNDGLSEAQFEKNFKEKGAYIIKHKGYVYSLVIPKNSKIKNKDLLFISNFKHLGVLKIKNGVENDQFIMSVKMPKTLVGLYINSKNITNKSLIYIGLLKNLGELDLRHTSITNNGLKHISNLQLNELYLDNTAITRDGLKHILGMNSLESISLFGNKITKEDVKWLEEKMPQCDVKWDGGVYDTGP